MLGSALVKWVTCEVEPSRRNAFSRAQEEGWAALAREDGFLCQVGGWDERSADTACILAIWTDADA